MVDLVKLGEICLVKRGTTITKNQTIKGDVPVIGGGTKPTYFHNQSNRDSNCITISGSGASAGFVNTWDEPIFASDCSTVEPKDDTQFHKFIYYFLLSRQKFIYENFRSGAAQPHVYAKDIASLDYPILPIAEQKLIVTKIDSIFSEIEKNISITKKQLSILNSLDSSIKNKLLFSNKSTKKLSDIAEINMGQSPAGSSYNSEGIGFVLVNGPVEFTEDPFGFTKSIKFTTAPTKFCEKNDALICVRGSTTGRMNIAREKACIGRGVASIRAKDNQKWVNYFLRSSRNLIFSLGKGSTFPNVSQSQLRGIEIPYPSLKDQNHIIQKLDKVEINMSIVRGEKETKLDQLLALKASLLREALK